MARIFGIATFSGLTGITGAVLSDFTVSADAEVKELRGNPSSVIVDIRTLANAMIMTVNVAFSVRVDPDTLIGTLMTLSATSEGVTPQTQSMTGRVTAAEIRGSKDDWWTYSVTIRKTA